MPSVSEIVFGAPVTAMDEKNYGMRPFSSRNTYVRKLIRVLPVGKAQIGVRWLLAENSFALHGKKYRTAARRKHSAKKRSGRPEGPARDYLNRIFYFGREAPLFECDGADDCIAEDDALKLEPDDGLEFDDEVEFEEEELKPEELEPDDPAPEDVLERVDVPELEEDNPELWSE